jgi:hypothetical protein
MWVLSIIWKTPSIEISDEMSNLECIMESFIYKLWIFLGAIKLGCLWDISVVDQWNTEVILVKAQCCQDFSPEINKSEYSNE